MRHAGDGVRYVGYIKCDILGKKVGNVDGECVGHVRGDMWDML